jgi:hypothetical protein
VIVDVKVVVIDGDRLAREIEYWCVTAARPLVRLERPHLFLRHPDENDAFTGAEPCAVRPYELVLALAPFERDEGHVMIDSELLDRGDKAVVSRLK